jgi:hypothetical protein
VRSRLSRLRAWLAGILVLGLAGTGTELLLIEHYEDPWQLTPLLLIPAALGVLGWHALRPGEASVGALRATMILFMTAGALGVGLHMRGSAQFQLEIDPTQGWWELSKKVIRAKAPPALAPGVMLQLGLLGLAYSYSRSNQTGSDT